MEKIKNRMKEKIIRKTKKSEDMKKEKLKKEAKRRK